MFDVCYLQDTHTPIFTLYVSVTLEYCTSCCANSLVAGSCSGMTVYTCYCFILLLSLIPNFCLTQSFMHLLITLGAPKRAYQRQVRWLYPSSCPETSRWLPRTIYIYSPCVVVGHCFGKKQCTFPIFLQRQYFEVVIMMVWIISCILDFAAMMVQFSTYALSRLFYVKLCY